VVSAITAPAKIDNDGLVFVVNLVDVEPPAADALVFLSAIREQSRLLPSRSDLIGAGEPFLKLVETSAFRQ
jgi:hypothetical protein